MKKKHIQHLYWRIGFGILPNELSVLSKQKKEIVIDNIFSASKTITPLKLSTPQLDDLLSGSYEKTRENIRKVQKLSKEKTKQLNVAWLDRLANSKVLLREKMTLFWANHFVCKDNVYNYSQKFHNTLREHALGNFNDFVVAISKEAAMTKYLNTKQNKKQKPNENFARELMELFTLGVGHYTEKDIKESAKAFTGYSHNLQGKFVFKIKKHDKGLKTFFGKTGHFKGEDIIDLILDKKQCAIYICSKLYRYFVNDTIDKNNVNAMADVFYKDYDIERVMRFMLLSDWFYDEKNIGTKIKSPVDFLVGIKTMVPVEFKKPKQLLYIQKLLGQVLLNPPNVAGWKGGRNWIDSNTIVMRLKLPSLILNDAYISRVEIGISDIKEETDKLAFKKQYGKHFKTDSDWNYFNNEFKNIALKDLGDYLLACSVNETAKKYLSNLKLVSKQEYCVQLMSLPEYQMC